MKWSSQHAQWIIHNIFSVCFGVEGGGYNDTFKSFIGIFSIRQLFYALVGNIDSNKKYFLF